MFSRHASERLSTRADPLNPPKAIQSSSEVIPRMPELDDDVVNQKRPRSNRRLLGA